MPEDPPLGRRPDKLRVPIPRDLEAGIIDAVKEMDSARQRRDALIVDALRLGCSLRDVAAAANLGHARVAQIGKEHGWPPPELAEERRRAREQAKRDRERWAEVYREVGIEPE